MGREVEKKRGCLVASHGGGGGSGDMPPEFLSIVCSSETHCTCVCMFKVLDLDDNRRAGFFFCVCGGGGGEGGGEGGGGMRECTPLRP